MGRKGAALVQSRGLVLKILRRTWKRRRRGGRAIRLSALFLGGAPHDLIATFCKSTIQFSTPGIKSGADNRGRGWGRGGGGGRVRVPRLFVPAPFAVSVDWPHSEPRGECRAFECYSGDDVWSFYCSCLVLGPFLCNVFCCKNK